MAKYKIVLDTNIVHRNDPEDLSALFRSDLDDLHTFLESNPKLSVVTVALPEMVINERIAQRMMQIEGSVAKIEASFDGLKSFGIKAPADNYKKEDYKKALQDKSYEIMGKYGIEILPTPAALQEKLIERALKKIKPFGKDKDIGFKDTVIWLTILDDAAKHDDVEYVFCTNNDADFDAEEFNTILGRELTVIKTIGALKEYLDSELVLNLKLKALYKEIEGIIKSKYIPEIMMKINSESKLFSATTLSDSFGEYLNNLGNPGYATIGYGSSSPSPTIAYRFKDMTFRNISQSGTNRYSIDLEVVVTPVKKQEQYMQSVTERVFGIMVNSPAKSFFLKIDFKKDTDSIDIQAVEGTQTYYVSVAN